MKNSKDKEMLRKAFSEFANSGRIVHFDDPLLKVAMIALRLDYPTEPAFYPTSEQEDSDLNDSQIVGGEMNCGDAGFLVAFLQDVWYYQSR